VNPRSIANPTHALYKRVARAKLKNLGKAFAAGDRMALFAAIRVCSNHDLPLPRWASAAYISAYDRVLNCELASWDDAFGRPYPKNVQLAVMHKRRQTDLRRGCEIVHRIGCIRSKGAVVMAVGRVKYPAIDDGLFERIGDEMSPRIGKTEVKRLYYRAKKLLGA
jgi:hypothetical protein